MPVLACDAHGCPLVRHEEGWVCAGWDGEAAGWCTAGPVPDEAAARLVAGVTRWLGVIVVTSAA
jgi:hypothetical protein